MIQLRQAVHSPEDGETSIEVGGGGGGVGGGGKRMVDGQTGEERNAS